MSDADSNIWKKCSVCKKAISLSSMYYKCSVSGCQSKRKGICFCSVQCWDAHSAVMNHRDAWAREATAPATPDVDRVATSKSSSRPPMRKVVRPMNTGSSGTAAAMDAQVDTLVVVSKVKKLVKERSGFSTSQCCIDALTQKVLAEALAAIANAKKAGRKTVMGRDVDVN